jgi:ribosomal protein L34
VQLGNRLGCKKLARHNTPGFRARDSTQALWGKRATGRTAAGGTACAQQPRSSAGTCGASSSMSAA